MDIRQLQTPCYIFNEEIYRENIRSFRDAFCSSWGGKCLFGYSVKTNHLRWPLLIARDEGFMTEVVSPDEYEYVQSLGIKDDEIIYNGPQKGKGMIDAVLKGAIVNLDSMSECELLIRTIADTEVAAVKKESFRVGIRINFDLEKLCPGETTMGAEVSRFGICSENGDLDRAVRMLRDNGISIKGIHMHQSSRTRSTAIFRAIAEKACETAERYDLDDIEFVDMGGGFFGGDFFPGKPSVKDYADTICDILKRKFDPSSVVLITEPGAGILATSWDYLTAVINLRMVKDRHIATLDGTLLHINPFMNPHEVPCTMIDPGERMEPGERDLWIFAGSTCMEKDRIDPRDIEYRPTEDSKILFHCCGAYMATHNSNFINAAPTVYAYSGKDYRLLRTKDPLMMGDY